jgi:hypothetical protein
MSPQAENFVHSLVEMAKAYDTLPSVEHALSEARHEIDHKSNTIQRLELKLMDRASEIDSLHAEIRRLEVARDDAELRFLESDDVASTLKGILKKLVGDAQGVLKAVEPPLPEPTPIEPFSPTTSSSDPVEVKTEVTDPIAAQVASTSTTTTTTEPIGSTDPVYPAPDLGQSATTPTTLDQPSAPNVAISEAQSSPASASSPNKGVSVQANPTTPVETPTDAIPPQTSAETTTVSPTTPIPTDGVSVPSDPTVSSTTTPIPAQVPPVATLAVGSHPMDAIAVKREPKKWDWNGEIRQEWWDWYNSPSVA